MLPDATSKPSALTILEHASKVLVLASVCVLALSVAYDFGYLFALGLWFSSLPTSVADHARTAIIWIPGAVLFILLVMILAKALAVASALVKKRWGGNRRFNESGSDWLGVTLFAVAALLGAGTSLRVMGTWSYLLGLPLCVWIAISLRELMNPLSTPSLSYKARKLVSLVAGAILAAAFVGYYLADQMVTFGKPDISIVLRVEGGQSTMLAKGMRRFSNVTIAVTGQTDVWVIPNDRIVSTQNKAFVKVGGVLHGVGGAGGPGEER